jgi:hypothetical protein
MDGYDLPPRPALRATPADYSVLPLHAEPLAVKSLTATLPLPLWLCSWIFLLFSIIVTQFPHARCRV